MKKLVIVLAVLILAALPALPFVNGILMERTVTGAFENLNQMYADTGSDMHIEIIEYDRGLFDTYLECRVNFGSLAGVYGVKDMVLVEKANHGFLGISSETSLEKNLWYSDWVKTKLNGKDPLKIRTAYSATGPIVSTVTMDGFPMETDKTPLNIGAFEFKVSVDKAFASFTTKGRWEGLVENETNKMGPVTFEADHTRLTNLIWAGKGAMSMENFTADEDGVSLALSDLSCTYDLTADPDHKKMSMGMGMNAGNIEFDGRSLSQWSVEWGLNNVDIQAYEGLAKLYYSVLNKYMAQLARPDLAPEDAGVIVQKAMAGSAPQFIGGLEKLLKKDLEIQVSKLDLELPQGKINGSLALGLKQDVTMAQFLMLAAQPDLALDIFSLQSDFSLPLALTGDRQDLTAPAFPGMKTGLFIREGERLTHRAEIRDNKLYLNGQEVVLEF